MAAAFVEEQAGEWEEAVRIQREGLDELTRMGEHAYASTVAADLALSLVELGRLDEAAAELATARELCPPGDIGTIVISDVVEAHLHLRHGRTDEAERPAANAVDVAETTDFWEFKGRAREALGRALAARGQGEEAAAELERAIEVYRSKGATVAEGRARTLLAEL
jgi:tetratricopeptide (TPR) repeat protein